MADLIHEIGCDLDENCLCAVRPSWWGKLPLPPVRPRYHIISLTGFTQFTRSSTSRKPRTTWAVHDRLGQGFRVGPDYFDEKSAETARARLEAEWEHYLLLTEEGTKTLDPEKAPKLIRWPRVRRHRKQPFRPTCPTCRTRATRPDQTHCNHCGSNLHFQERS